MRSFLKCYFSIFFFFLCTASFSQQIESRAKNTLYIEGAGVGGYGSLNYERIYFFSSPSNRSKQTAIACRLGISTYYLNDYTDNFNPEIILPLALHFLYGKSHKLELGIGQTFTSFVRADTNTFKPVRDIRNHTHFTLGYRYQPLKGGIMLRIAYTPMLEFNTDYTHWGGLAIGYAF